MQYLTCVIVGFSGAFLFEDLHWEAIQAAAITVALWRAGFRRHCLYVAESWRSNMRRLRMLRLSCRRDPCSRRQASAFDVEGFTGQKIAGCALILVAILSVEAKALFKIVR